MRRGTDRTQSQPITGTIGTGMFQPDVASARPKRPLLPTRGRQLVAGVGVGSDFSSLVVAGAMWSELAAVGMRVAIGYVGATVGDHGHGPKIHISAEKRNSHFHPAARVEAPPTTVECFFPCGVCSFTSWKGLQLTQSTLWTSY